MKESERLRLLISLIGTLNRAGSWTGRTHIHKFIYFAQRVLGLATGYDFILYQRGPYSFDLDSDIRLLRSLSAIDIEPMGPYGPTYRPTNLGNEMAALAGFADSNIGKRLELLAGALGPKTARDLELLATTFYVQSEGHPAKDAVIERVLTLKPHFSRSQAVDAIKEVSSLIEKIQST
jgi:hypothetical protein